jgi:hypothetical protein
MRNFSPFDTTYFHSLYARWQYLERQISTTTNGEGERKRSGKEHEVTTCLCRFNLLNIFIVFRFTVPPSIVITWKSSICQEERWQIKHPSVGIVMFCDMFRTRSLLKLPHPFLKMSSQLTMLNWFSFTPFRTNISPLTWSRREKGLQLNLQIQFSIYHAIL